MGHQSVRVSQGPEREWLVPPWEDLFCHTQVELPCNPPPVFPVYVRKEFLPLIQTRPGGYVTPQNTEPRRLCESQGITTWMLCDVQESRPGGLCDTTESRPGSYVTPKNHDLDVM